MFRYQSSVLSPSPSPLHTTNAHNKLKLFRKGSVYYSSLDALIHLFMFYLTVLIEDVKEPELCLRGIVLSYSNTFLQFMRTWSSYLNVLVYFYSTPKWIKNLNGIPSCDWVGICSQGFWHQMHQDSLYHTYYSSLYLRINWLTFFFPQYP